jgi:hypothetical protein
VVIKSRRELAEGLKRTKRRRRCRRKKKRRKELHLC